MDKEDSPIYGHDTVEFVTVALEYCYFVEKAAEESRFHFIDKAIKLLPLLYLKATMLPDLSDTVDGDEVVQTVTENSYDALREQLQLLLGEHDSYLDTFMEDMQYSDTPITACISEDLSDVFQATGDFIAIYREAEEQSTLQAIVYCKSTFENYWGQKLLNALKALHAVRYSEEMISEAENEDSDND